MAFKTRKIRHFSENHASLAQTVIEIPGYRRLKPHRTAVNGTFTIKMDAALETDSRLNKGIDALMIEFRQETAYVKRSAVYQRTVTEIRDQLVSSHGSALALAVDDFVARLVECDQLLSRSGMQGHGPIEIGLCGAHLERNTQKLRHFSGIRPDNMHP